MTNQPLATETQLGGALVIEAGIMVPVTIAEGLDLPRGALLGRIAATGEYQISAPASTDGSQYPVGVLALAVDSTGGAAAGQMLTAGTYSSLHMTFGTGWDVGTLQVQLGSLGWPFLMASHGEPAAAAIDPLVTTPPVLDLSVALYDIAERNAAVLDELAPITFPADIVTFGASLTANTPGGAGTDWPTLMGTWVANAIHNEAVGGETPSEIVTRINASAYKNLPASLQGGDNIISTTAHTFAAMLTGHNNMDAALDAVPNSLYWHMGISGSQGSNAASINGQTRYMLGKELRAIHGALYRPFIEVAYKAKPEADFTATELNAVYANHLPNDPGAAEPLAVDDTHPSALVTARLAASYTYCWGALHGLATICSDDFAPLDEAAVADDVVHTVETAGATPADFAIVGGNADGFFDINSAGEITVTAAGEGNLTDDYYDLAVRAWPAGASISSGWRHEAAIRLCRAGNSGFGGVTVRQRGAIGVVQPPAFTNFTICVGMKFPAGETGASGLLYCDASSGTFIQSNGTTQRGRFQWNLKDPAGATIATRSITNAFTGDPEAWFWFMLSYNQTAGTCLSMVSRLVSGTPTNITHAPDSGTLTGNLDFGETFFLFTNSNNFGTAAPRDYRRVLIFDHAWDLSSPTDRNKFFNSTTDMAPVALPSNYQIDGVTPFLARDFHRPGDILPARWVGSGVDKLTVNWPHQLGTPQYASAA